MVVIGDVLEHFEKQRAWEFLDRCVSCSSKYLILNLGRWGKIGFNLKFMAIHTKSICRFGLGRSWNYFVWKYRTFEMSPGKYGSFLIRKEDYLAYKLYSSQDTEGNKYSVSL